MFRSKIKKFFSALGAAILLATPFSTPSQAADKVLVYAASSLKDVLEEAGQAYEKKTGTKTIFSFAGTPVVSRQVVAGAPADILMTANREWMDYVEKQGAVKDGSTTLLASNGIVVVAPKGTAANMPLTNDAIEARLDGMRFSIGEPDSVPAGRYAKQALVSLGLWHTVSGQLAPMDNVRVALAAVARKELPLGIVYSSDAQIEKGVQVVAELPESSHNKIELPAALTKTASAQAVGFLGFLKSPEGQAIFKKFGFKAAVH